MTSSWRNEQSFSLEIIINHFKTESVFFIDFVSFLLILSSSFFAGFIYRPDRFSHKSGLWSLSVIIAGVFVIHSMRSSRLMNLAMFLLLGLIMLMTKHFYLTRKFHKIFNHNTVKIISNMTISNMTKIIKIHNRKVTAKPHDQILTCNRRKRRMSNIKLIL